MNKYELAVVVSAKIEDEERQSKLGSCLWSPGLVPYYLHVVDVLVLCRNDQ